MAATNVEVHEMNHEFGRVRNGEASERPRVSPTKMPQSEQPQPCWQEVKMGPESVRVAPVEVGTPQRYSYVATPCDNIAEPMPESFRETPTAPATTPV